MGDIVKEKISADLATASRTAEKLRFRADFWGMLRENWPIYMAIVFAAVALEAAHHHDFRPAIGFIFVGFYSALHAFTEACLNRRHDRREALHARARRVFIVRRRRESLASFEQRVAVQERYLDGQS